MRSSFSIQCDVKQKNTKSYEYKAECSNEGEVFFGLPLREFRLLNVIRAYAQNEYPRELLFAESEVACTIQANSHQSLPMKFLL